MRRVIVFVTTVALAAAGVVAPVVSWSPLPAQAAEVETWDIPIDGVEEDVSAAPQLLDPVEVIEDVPDTAVGDAQFLGGLEQAPSSSDQVSASDVTERLAAVTEHVDVEPFVLAGVTWDIRAYQDILEVAVQVEEDGHWTQWQALEVLPLMENASVSGAEPLLTSGATGIRVRVLTESGVAPAGLSVELIDPGLSAADAQAASAHTVASAAVAAASQPAIVPRSTWMASGHEKYTTWSPKNSPRLDAMYIHHTAGSNTYSAAQATAQVRAIYTYHARTLGWGDIGYNFLVDRFGTIYEGRQGSLDGIPQGAHAGNYNANTIGISGMGNFSSLSAPSAMTNAMVKVLAWKGAQYGINPRGTATLKTGSSKNSTGRGKPGSLVEVPTILGHRETNYTACPGDKLNSRLPAIRSAVASAMATGTVTALAKPKVAYLKAPYRPIALNNKIPLTWGGVSGASRYEVGLKLAPHGKSFGAVKVVASTTARQHTVKLPTGVSARLYVRAVADDGRRSAWSFYGTLTRSLPTSELKRTSGSWKRVASSKFYRGFTYQSRVKNSRIKVYNAKDVSRVQLVVGKGKGYGRVAVYAGKTRIKTVSLNSSKKTYRSTVTLTLPKRFSGTITLKTLDNKPVRVSAVTVAR